MNTSETLQSLKGIGEKTAQSFQKLHIYTIGDLLLYLPREYDQIEEITPVGSLKEAKRAVVRVKVISSITEKRVRSLVISNVYAADQSGKLLLTFFNMPYIKHQLKRGVICLLRGQVHFHGQIPVIEQPVIMKQDEYDREKGHLQPIYPLINGIKQNVIRKASLQALSQISFEEFLPQTFLQQYQLCSYDEALHAIHYPNSLMDLQAAHKRLAFDEFLFFLLNVNKLKGSVSTKENAFPMINVADTTRLIQSLPYELTNAQKKVWHEIAEELSGSYCMNRLVQGDVGSGKTILAILALLMTAANDYQGALMAPTEVLALQHFESIRSLSKEHDLPLQPILLTGSLTAKEKRQAYELIQTRKVNCIIGTHALIQEKVNYNKLALVITDEQHRFGVRQREAFMQKGKTPHVCVMSATPIPRTLAMILYGDLHISSIRELPAKRLPIKNCVLRKSDRTKAYGFIQKEVLSGRQAFVICPMIEPSEEDMGLENVETYSQKLSSILSDTIQVAVLHGKMKPQEKSRIMNAFARKEIDVLVSTTVIEVGINIPNATVMLIENSERFGLAQLHQLRGRVGRGQYQSYCIFINCSESEHAQKRLDVLEKSNDGFFIAEQDLKLRGPGDFFGIRQSGDLNFRIADIYQDADILSMAEESCQTIMRHDNWEILPEYQLLYHTFEHSFQNDIDFPSI